MAQSQRRGSTVAFGTGSEVKPLRRDHSILKRSLHGWRDRAVDNAKSTRGWRKATVRSPPGGDVSPFERRVDPSTQSRDHASSRRSRKAASHSARWAASDRHSSSSSHDDADKHRSHYRIRGSTERRTPRQGASEGRRPGTLARHDAADEFLDHAERAGMAYVLIRLKGDRNTVRVVVLHQRGAVKYMLPIQVKKWIDTGAKRLPQSPQLDNGDDMLDRMGPFNLIKYEVPEHFTYDSSIAELFPDDPIVGAIAVIPMSVSVGGTVVARASPNTNFSSDLELYKGYESGTRGKVVVLGACVALLAAAADAGYHANTLPPGTDKSHLLPLGRLVAWVIAGVSVVWLVNAFSQTKYLRDGPTKAVLSYRQT